mmetsp:Transcript_71258/g.130473  ORF Transcript_71258/g.130473 Transcript_71258/m.130473 type:complete len:318 (+) Transcript_71258:36-989(+)
MRAALFVFACLLSLAGRIGARRLATRDPEQPDQEEIKKMLEDLVAELEAQREGEKRSAQLDTPGEAPEPEFDNRLEFGKAFLKAARAGHLLGQDFVAELEAHLTGEEQSAHFEKGEAASGVTSASELDHLNWPQFNKAFVEAARAGQLLGADFVAELEAQLKGGERQAEFATPSEAPEPELDARLSFNKAFIEAARAGQHSAANFVAGLEEELKGEKRKADHATPLEAPESEFDARLSFNEAFMEACRQEELVWADLAAELEAELDGHHHSLQDEEASKVQSESELEHHKWVQFNEAFVKAAQVAASHTEDGTGKKE